MRISIIFILLITIISCSRNQDDILRLYGGKITDTEENETIEQAININVTETIVGYFHKKDIQGDKDYYLLTLPDERASYKMVLSPVSGIDSRISVYTKENRLLYTIDAGSVGEAEKLWDIKATNGNEVIIVIESKNGSNEVTPYIVNFINNGIDSRIEKEPNNITEEAELIGIPGVRRGYISPANDKDCFRIQGSDTIKEFNLRVETLSNLDVAIKITTESTGLSRIIDRFGWGGDEFINYIATTNSDYIIEITGKIKSDDIGDPLYYIHIDEIISKDNKYFEREFNDSFENSSIMINNSTVIGMIYPENDKDYFVFDTIYDNGSLILSLSPVKGLNTKIELLNENKQVIDYSDNNGIDGGEELGVNRLTKGRYYVRVSAGEGASPLSYDLYFDIRY